MKRIKLFLIFLFLPLLLKAQGENNIWLFSGTYMDFNTSPVSIPENGDSTISRYPPVDPSVYVYSNDYAQAVCSADGTLRFSVRLCPSTDLLTQNMLLSADGTAIPNSVLRNDHGSVFSNNRAKPVIVGRPGNADQYYIFYSYSGALYYSLLDMSLNGGQGGIVAGEKDVKINGFGAVWPNTTLAVQGCDGIWLVARSFTAAEYLSYHITASGVDTASVRSAVGGAPLTSANQFFSTYARASADNKMIATVYDVSDMSGITSYVELYDFERCSGKLGNARIIDSGFRDYDLPEGEFSGYAGFEFSPDNSKFYLGQNITASDSFNDGFVAYAAYGTGGCVFQFDLSLPDMTSVIASKTLVLNNPRAIIQGPCLICCAYHFKFPFEDMKRGPDGNIYVYNNANTCSPYSSPPGYNIAPGYHVIKQPDLAGLGCDPQTNVLGNIYEHNIGASYNMLTPKDAVFAPYIPDTIAGINRPVTVCFADSVLLIGSDNARCYHWLDTVAGRQRTVTASGSYYFGYLDDACSYRTDTFTVDFVKLPQITSTGYSCPGAYQGTASVRNAAGDAHSFTYQWRDALGNTVSTSTSSSGDDCTGLDTGINHIRIITGSGCDTTLSFMIKALPMPTASFEADTIACKGEPLQFTNTSSAPVYTWYTDWRTPYTDKNPQITFPVAGDHDVYLVVQNVEGCYDTGHIQIHVKEMLLSLTADPDIADRGEVIRWRTSAPEPYSVLSWYPQFLFSNQTAKSQDFPADTSTTYVVVGRSEAFGCIDSARASVKVEPVILMPDAFSPNGDGVNDYFAPVILGRGTIVNSFLVFNRWGQAIFEANGNLALRGWDGLHSGKPVDIGTYHYLITMATMTGNVRILKGNVTLIR